MTLINLSKRDQLIFEHHQLMKELDKLNKKKAWSEKDGERFEEIKKRELEIKNDLDRRR